MRRVFDKNKEECIESNEELQSNNAIWNLTISLVGKSRI